MISATVDAELRFTVDVTEFTYAMMLTTASANTVVLNVPKTAMRSIGTPIPVIIKSKACVTRDCIHLHKLLLV